mgnify:CR=1 FL=1|tara:strand:+ start:3259 stop:3510 length:252 start_codon:yes stop_codon:yes gene_type:complete
MIQEQCLGEKIETIILSRKDTSQGKYLGSSAQTFGAALINGVVYKVMRNLEVSENWFWKVFNVNTGKTITLKDQYDLPCLREA